MRDLASNIRAVPVISPAVQTATVTSAPVDLKGAERGCFVVHTGAIAGAGAFGVKLQHSDTTTAGDFVDVPADQVQGAAPAQLAADAAYEIGYSGWKRYVRVVATRASGTSLALGATVILTNLVARPAT